MKNSSVNKLLWHTEHQEGFVMKHKVGWLQNLINNSVTQLFQPKALCAKQATLWNNEIRLFKTILLLFTFKKIMKKPTTYKNTLLPWTYESFFLNAYFIVLYRIEKLHSFLVLQSRPRFLAKLSKCEEDIIKWCHKGSETVPSKAVLSVLQNSVLQSF